jgi:hypothetical protein
MPGAGRLLLGVALGALVAAVLSRLPRMATVAAGVVAVGLLASAASGYVARNAAANSTFAAPVLQWFATQPAWVHGSDPIAVAPNQIGPLAGDRLRHDVQLIGTHESCAQIHARELRGWVVVRVIDPRILALLAPAPAQQCLAGERPVFDDGAFRVYRVPSR